jgi:acetyltransferase-like isoleucine patch superfamily enzyme
MLSNFKSFVLNYISICFKRIEQSKINYEKQQLFSQFKKAGKNFRIGKDFSIKNPQFIEIGNNFSALERIRIEAWDFYQGEKYYPQIKIGNNVVFNTDIHIGCTNKITIGDNCLFASRIYITDHQHGDTSDGMINLTPIKRPLVSKGPVIIENNVWVGEGVTILPGITIGVNSIIGANSVVTRDVAKNTVVAGIPAKTIKTLIS